ncbi:MAG: RAMP superfamily CRISPR-associated protein [Oscillochloridaceae bacterium umkhey_bin13]
MKLEIAMTITSETALSVGAGGSSGTLADKSIVRDGWGRPIIPGSQLKGKLRWAAEQLLRGLGYDIPTPFEGRDREDMETVVRALFGSPQHRSRLHFADLPGIIGPLEQSETLRSSPEQHRSQIRPSVVINRQRGTAADSLLVFQEVAPEPMRFHAERAIIGMVDDQEHAALLWAAACLTPRWGGATSRGLGWASVDMAISLDDEPQSEEMLKHALRTMIERKGAA